MADKKVKERTRTTYDICSEVGIPALTPSQFLRHLDYCYAVGTSVLVQGRPGSGKNELTRLFARTRQLKYYLEHFNGKDPTDLGLPYMKDERDGFKRHMWSLPWWFVTAQQELEEEYPGGWLDHFDETAQAVPAMQNKFGEMVNERSLNGIGMHPKVFIVMSCNFAQDKGATFPIPRQITNKVSVVGLAPNLEDSLRYCTEHDIDWRLRAYIKAHPDCLDSFDPDSVLNATGRSIMELSPFLRQELSGDAFTLVAQSRVGEGKGNDIAAYVALAGEIPTVEEIEQHPTSAHVPDDEHPDQACMIAAMLGHYMNVKNAKPLIQYLTRMDSEYCVFALQDAWRRDEKLRKCKAMIEWAVDKGDVLS